MAKEDPVVPPIVPPQDPALPTNPTGGNAEGENINPEDSRVTSPKSVAAQVLAGQWGRGRARDARLKAAGHDPKAVRAEVNKILGR